MSDTKRWVLTWLIANAGIVVAGLAMATGYPNVFNVTVALNAVFLAIGGISWVWSRP